MRRKAVAVLLALVMAVFALTGCTKHEADISTLYSSNALKIEREGAETCIYDIEGDTVYTFTSHRVKKGAAEPVQAAQTTADTGEKCDCTENKQERGREHGKSSRPQRRAYYIGTYKQPDRKGSGGSLRRIRNADIRTLTHTGL